MQVLFYSFLCFFVVLVLWVLKCEISNTRVGNKLIAKLSFKQTYILEDFQGQRYYTRSSYTNNAPVFPSSNVGSVHLLPDGTTSGNSCYIKTWEKY